MYQTTTTSAKWDWTKYNNKFIYIYLYSQSKSPFDIFPHQNSSEILVRFSWALLHSSVVVRILPYALHKYISFVYDNNRALRTLSIIQSILKLLLWSFLFERSKYVDYRLWVWIMRWAENLLFDFKKYPELRARLWPIKLVSTKWKKLKSLHSGQLTTN